jgi:hypothetical protein
MLQRMLASHSAIYSHPEPHLITPLYYLGYYATVDKAPYDHVNAAQALRELTEELPRGEADYLDALRAYTDTLYGRVLAPTGKAYFLDKTPAYALVLPFLAKLYPDATYVVLTRHPLAVMHSVAHSFFGGDYAAAEAANPIVARYVPAIGRFLLDAPVSYVHVRYEDLVLDPEAQMRRILEHIGVPFEATAVNYGSQRHISKSYGDPVSVEKHQRPVTDSMTTWAQDLAANPEALKLAQRTTRRLEDAHLQAWGYPRTALLEPLGTVVPQRTRRARLDTYQVKRQVLLTLRRNVHDTALGDAVRKLRYYCDVLLRT